MSEYFSKSKPLTGDMKVELDVSNYAAKADLRNATGVYPSKVPKKIIIQLPCPNGQMSVRLRTKRFWVRVQLQSFEIET